MALKAAFILIQSEIYNKISLASEVHPEGKVS